MLEALKDYEVVCECCKLRPATDIFDDAPVCNQCRVVLGRFAGVLGRTRSGPSVRDPMTVQRVHDLVNLALGDPDVSARLNLPHEIVIRLVPIANCLCWVLGHGDFGGRAFEGLIEGLEARLAAAGIGIVAGPDLQ